MLNKIVDGLRYALKLKDESSWKPETGNPRRQRSSL